MKGMELKAVKGNHGRGLGQEREIVVVGKVRDRVNRGRKSMERKGRQWRGYEGYGIEGSERKLRKGTRTREGGCCGS